MGTRRNTRWETMDKNNIPLTKVIEYFEIYNKSEGKPPKTITWYHDVLTMFMNWLNEQGYDTNLGSVSEKEVREFILWLQNRHFKEEKASTETVNNRVRALRAFYNWLYHKGYTKEHLLQDVKPPRLPGVMVETLSDEEIDLLSQELDQSTILGSRNTQSLLYFLTRV